MNPLSGLLKKYYPVIIGLLALGALVWWLTENPTRDFSLSEPGADGFAEGGVFEEEIIIGEHFKRFSDHPPVPSERWPRFRGDQSDNISRSPIPLISSFNGRVPDVLWSVQLGEGHSGAAIYDGLVYVLDYDEESRADMLRCFVLETGEEVWRRWYHLLIRRNHGMSRTVPAVTEDFILTIGPRGHVMCLDRLTGDFLWGIDIEKEYNSEIPLWYTGQCPLIDEGVAIIATGGDALMIGVDCATGEVLWRVPNPDRHEMSHSSVIPYTFGGRKMYLYSGIGIAAGIAADGPDAGTILWQTNRWNFPVVAPSPVGMPDGRILLTAGYGAGTMLLQLREANGSFTVEVAASFSPGEGLSSEQQTPILLNGLLYGIMPKDARGLRNQFVCVRADDPTRVVWSSGASARFGLGPYILADNKFFLLNDDATLHIIELSTTRYRELDKVRLFDGFDAWAPLAIANGLMVLRDSEKMICIDLRKK